MIKQAKLRISSENYKDISIRLASLKPVLKIALDGLKVPLSAPKPEPTLAFVKPAPELKASVEPAKVVQEKPEDFAAQRNALIKSFEEKASAARAAQEASGSEQNSANEAIQVRSLAAKSKEFATNITSPDAAITTLNDLLAVEGKKYNLSDAQEKSLLISDLENLQHFLEDPNNNEQNQALINRLLKKMQSSLTLTSDNCKRISNSLVSLKEIAQKALNKLQTPAPATWGSYFGLNV